MSREDTQFTQNVVTKSSDSILCRVFAVIIVVTAGISGYFVFKSPSDSLGDPSDQYVIKNIPKTFTKLEAVDPEERDVFHGFRTSFLPPDEIVLSQDAKEQNGAKKPQSARIKRRSYFMFTSQDYEHSSDNSAYQKKDEINENEYKESSSGVEDDYDSSDQNENENQFDRIIHPEPHVDRGPLDDVVEQVRRQPELEEGEMGTAAHNIYKPSKSYAGIHAFWKDQGDRDTILKTQANIMKQYMDPSTDPCEDFYQYACGNWAALNPIPADKAGYDTFEMLRESLDAVLKDLLEFKSNEQVISIYPGSKLDLDENILTRLTPTTHKHNILKKIKHSVEIIENISKQLFNITSMHAHKYDISSNPDEKYAVGNRIRRYLDRKEKIMKNKFTKSKAHTKENYKYSKNYNNSKSTKYPNKNNKHNKNHRNGRKLKKSKQKRELFESKVEEEPKIKQDLSNGDATLKARFLFKSCMNYDILHKRGHEPLLDLLDLLGGWPILKPQWNDTNFDWLDLMAKLRLYNNDILISEWVGPDIKNSDEFVIQFDQTSLGLPTRDYFLQDSNKIYLEAYKNYLIKIALLLGGDHEYVVTSASELIEFETKLAKITSAPEDRRNVSELYRRMTLDKLETLVPQIQWRNYLCIVLNRTVKSDETVVLFALNYVRHLVELIKETDSKILSNYLLWRFVRHRVNNLDDRFQSAKQQFYFTLFGREQSPPRWKNCISQVNSNMGMALGSMFVRKYFDEKSKNDTLTMTKELQQSFRELLHLTNWIDNETKTLAAHKVDAMMLRIGYPDFILNENELNDRYREVKIHPDKYFENVLNILQHLTKMEQSRLGQAVNKTLWNTAPAVVNAYYSRNKNQIMFPAGILQPPFYHRHFPRSLNYGGIGVVIGHEITHGFDDKGRLFDCNGNLHRWWSDSAIELFHKRAQCLIDQYGQYVVPEVHMKLDGVNTQGENIADNGGIKQSFRAYLHWLSKNGVEGETLPSLNHTHTQLFFLNFAQVWCGAMRPEAMKNKLKTAVHSPGRFRVIGTLSNSHDFAREFRCPPGSPMNPTNKCSVW